MEEICSLLMASDKDRMDIPNTDAGPAVIVDHWSHYTNLYSNKVSIESSDIADGSFLN